jgi:methylphosphotriester-DNA--protein-cysteine methyltransferase
MLSSTLSLARLYDHHRPILSKALAACVATATGLPMSCRQSKKQMSPIAYLQRVRTEEAKHRLERTEASVDEISWQVGDEAPLFSDGCSSG